MNLLVDIADFIPDGMLNELRKALPSHNVVAWSREGNNSIPLDSVDWVLVWHPDRKMMEGITSIRTIFSMGAGIDHITGLESVPDSVPIVRFVDSGLTNQMSEWVVLQCLMHLRQQHRYNALRNRKQWRRLAQPAADEITVGILGLGVLGTDAAIKLKHLGFQLRGWSQTEKTLPGVRSFAGPSSLSEFLAGTDFLVSLLPATAQTTGLVNREILRQLAPCKALGGPVFINAGRGATHIESDIVQALVDGTLSGVSLDVFEQEPLPADSLLWTLPQAILTPHAAAWSSHKAIAEHVARQIALNETDQAYEHMVDRKAGY